MVRSIQLGTPLYKDFPYRRGDGRTKVVELRKQIKRSLLIDKVIIGTMYCFIVIEVFFLFFGRLFFWHLVALSIVVAALALGIRNHVRWKRLGEMTDALEPLSGAVYRAGLVVPNEEFIEAYSKWVKSIWVKKDVDLPSQLLLSPDNIDTIYWRSDEDVILITFKQNNDNAYYIPLSLTKSGIGDLERFKKALRVICTVDEEKKMTNDDLKNIFEKEYLPKGIGLERYPGQPL